MKENIAESGNDPIIPRESLWLYQIWYYYSRQPYVYGLFYYIVLCSWKFLLFKLVVFNSIELQNVMNIRRYPL